MSATPLHRTPDTRVPFVVALISGTAALAMATFAMFIVTTGI